MTKQSRCKFSAKFKAKVALEAIKNEKTMTEQGHQFEVNPVTISKWKNEFLKKVPRDWGYQTKNGNDPVKS